MCLSGYDPGPPLTEHDECAAWIGAVNELQQINPQNFGSEGEEIAAAFYVRANYDRDKRCRVFANV